MNNYPIHKEGVYRKNRLPQIIRVMRITAFLLLIALAQVSAAGFGQKLTMRQDKATLKDVFEQIKHQTGYDVVWKSGQLKRTKAIAINYVDAEVENVLKDILPEQKLDYTLNGNTYVIKRLAIVENNIVIKEKVKELFERVVDRFMAIEVKGRVVNEKDEPLTAVSVQVKSDKTKGTITDANGYFSISVPDEAAVLVISSVGFMTQEIIVGRKINLIIKLVADNAELDEVVVVGYGTQSKRNLATSTVRVTANELKGAVINTVDQALLGRAAGVQVVTSSGEPGASAIVRIRGNNSLSGNNDPLYVIDGFPMPPYKEATNGFYGSFSQNGLYGINPNDIESIEVLKDASATAIYGSRGANGVVLIITKAGKRGESKLEIVNKTSVGHIINPLKMMNGKQYAQIINESYILNNNAPPFGNIDTIQTSTDWVGSSTRPAFREDLTLSASGGGEKTSYFISGNYLKDKGTLFNSDNSKASLRVNLNNEINSWYTIKAQLSFVRQKSNRAITTTGGWPDGAGLMDLLKSPPTADLNYLGTNAAAIPGGESPGGHFNNPYIELLTKTDVSKNDYMIFNLENAFRIANGLQLVASVGSVQNLTRRQIYLPATGNGGYFQNGKGNNSMANTYSYNVNGYFLYDKIIKTNHRLNATLGIEYNTQTLEMLGATTSNYNLPSFGISNIGSALVQQTSSYREDRKIQSGFVRVNYSYQDKYILNASVRTDGASPFAANKKYGVFPAVSLGWNIDQEKFMDAVDFISNSKIRISYGETGSQAIAPYSSLSQFDNAFYQIGSNNSVVTAIYPFTLGNNNLTWERTKQFNSGLDFSTIKDRLTFSFDWYRKLTVGLLQPRALPSQSGYSIITDNYGTMRNQGIEFSVQADLFRQKSFKFTTRLNITRNQNVLVDLGEKTSSDYIAISGNLLGGVSGILTPGQEIGQFFGYKLTGLTQIADFTAGVPNYPYPGAPSNQIPGVWKYEDLDKNNVIDAKDRQILGKSSPDFTYGWTNDISYKNISVNMFFIGSVGNDILNLTRFYLNNGLVNYGGTVFNNTEEWYTNRWTTDRPHNDVYYPAVSKGLGTGDITSSMIENGSYFRLKSLTVSYAFPNIKEVKNLRLSLIGTNLFTITKYNGFDPEVSNFSQSLLYQGIDYGAYPAQRSYTIGLSCNF